MPSVPTPIRIPALREMPVEEAVPLRRAGTGEEGVVGSDTDEVGKGAADEVGHVAVGPSVEPPFTGWPPLISFLINRAFSGCGDYPGLGESARRSNSTG